jgi:hypothetical protein
LLRSDTPACSYASSAVAHLKIKVRLVTPISQMRFKSSSRTHKRTYTAFWSQLFRQFGIVPKARTELRFATQILSYNLVALGSGIVCHMCSHMCRLLKAGYACKTIRKCIRISPFPSTYRCIFLEPRCCRTNLSCAPPLRRHRQSHSRG